MTNDNIKSSIGLSLGMFGALIAILSLTLGLTYIVSDKIGAASGKTAATELLDKEIKEAVDEVNDAKNIAIEEILIAKRPMKVRIVEGKHISCAAGWPTESIATCPPDTMMVGGGCDFTCIGLDHSSSIPTSTSTWACKAISDDTTRTFRAMALCVDK